MFVGVGGCGAKATGGAPNRLPKKAHLRGPILRTGTPRARALVAAYLEYASLGVSLAALRLNLFEQPGEERVSRDPVNSTTVSTEE